MLFNLLIIQLIGLYIKVPINSNKTSQKPNHLYLKFSEGIVAMPY
jgi:hypothetical protein